MRAHGKVVTKVLAPAGEGCTRDKRGVYMPPILSSPKPNLVTPVSSPKPTLVTPVTPSRSRPSTRNNPTPLDAMFILFASVALVILILSFAAFPRESQVPSWLTDAVTGIWKGVFAGAGAIGSLALRKWLDNRPKPNYLIWIPAFTVFLLAAVLVVTKAVGHITIVGRIDSPTVGQIVSRTFDCNGTATPGTGAHLWLAVEVNKQTWPREGGVTVLEDGTWKAKVFEDGATDTFSLSLLLANSTADKKIREWLTAGQTRGRYDVLQGEIPGTTRLWRIDGLKLAPK